MSELIRCIWCGSVTQLIWIHGHGQCAICGTNIDECCRGEFCKDLNSDPSKTTKS